MWSFSFRSGDVCEPSQQTNKVENVSENGNENENGPTQAQQSTAKLCRHRREAQASLDPNTPQS